MDQPVTPNRAGLDGADTQARARTARTLVRGGAVVGVLAFIVVVWSIFAVHRASAKLKEVTEAQSVITVATIQPQPLSELADLILPGNLQANYEAPIYARTSGYLKRWLVDIGTPVKAGQLLGEIESPEVESQLNQARADLVTAEANQKIASVTAERWRNLRASDSVSKQEADEKISIAASNDAQVQAAKANVQRLRELTSFQKIVAPFDGVVTARNTDIGQLIVAGSNTGPELFRVADMRRLRLYVRVPQTYAALMKPGITADLVFPDRPGKIYTAKLDSTSSAIEQSTRTLLAQLSVENTNNELLPGAYSEVHFKLPVGASNASFKLPANVLLFRGDGMHVATVGENGQVVLKAVTVGRDYGSDIEIVQGLGAEDKVILSPPDSLTNGVNVHVAAPSPGAGCQIVRRASYVACVVATAMSGCSLAPKYHEPPPPAAVASYEEAGDWMPAAPADSAPRGAWWEAFGEPTLSDLERQLSESNPDLRAAVARFQQARGLAIQARSNIFPTLGAESQVTRGKSSTNAPLTRALNATPSASSDFLAGLNLNWEVDLFGRLRNASSAANAQAQASAADFAAVQLSLQAELATDFFSLRGDDTTIQLLEDTIKVYDRAFELTRNRYKEGISAATDVDQADTLRQNARSQLAAVRLERAQLEHAIAVLLGQVPSLFRLDPGQLAGAPPSLDAGLPSKLLERRPDVSRAERNMAAANAQVGVARAAWFPVFSIAGAAGFESINSSSWFEAPSHFWSVGPAAVVPLLDGGARYGLNKQARAQYDEAMETYRKTTLTAYQEVEDSLAGLHHLADQRRADEAAASSAHSFAYHADQRYDAGVADYVEVTTTHTAALNAQRDTISVRVAQMNASVALVRATGGGWTQDQLDHPAMP